MPSIDDDFNLRLDAETLSSDLPLNTRYCLDCPVWSRERMLRFPVSPASSFLRASCQSIRTGPGSIRGFAASSTARRSAPPLLSTLSSLSTLSTGHRHYSSKSPPQDSRSQFKILPFVAILLIGTGSYVFLVKSRASARPAAIQRN
ncbi:hypothetical protein BGW36DRAFT_425986 [Talaromyces proteolyticus]|uniref:Uncharacterized protein n=1 Tax=Talaromyces proteolyticus TaxID=1131652 RepID=A0AAD4KTR1_9EURO|nr:uncharacterized protein BGW36DRAFT_425986 [Talaromyces proteolyticus]KAH8698274.1 hypothetical protein BGW36DRAFT_425986 [Talaromyces proteolyticus]